MADLLKKQKGKRGPKIRGREFDAIFALVCTKTQKEYVDRMGVKFGSASEWARKRLGLDFAPSARPGWSVSSPRVIGPSPMLLTLIANCTGSRPVTRPKLRSTPPRSIASTAPAHGFWSAPSAR